MLRVTHVFYFEATRKKLGINSSDVTRIRSDGFGIAIMVLTLKQVFISGTWKTKSQMLSFMRQSQPDPKVKF